MTLSVIAPLLPLVVAAAALGRTVVESVAEEGRGRDTRVVSILVSLGVIALFLLELGELPVRERIVVAVSAVALWLLARAQRDPRLVIAATCVVALLAGAEPALGLGFVPALGVVIVGQRALPERFAQRGGLLFVVALAIGWFAFGVRPSLAHFRWHAWLDGALHAAGPISLGLAAAGLWLALTSTTGRRVQGATVVLALGGTIPGGHFGATSALLVSLALGLGLLEASAHLARLKLPGARFVLGPVLLLALMEPLSLRVEGADLRWPDLGAVPPAHVMLNRCPCLARC